MFSLNSQYSQYFYSDTPVPRFNSQPFKVFSTPGLGNFFNDHALYSHVHYFQPNVKEVEKSIEPQDGEGGIELNSPLIPESLVSKKPTKKSKKKTSSRSIRVGQKGHGKASLPTNDDIKEAFEHPIKVINTASDIPIFFYTFLGITS